MVKLSISSEVMGSNADMSLEDIIKKKRLANKAAKAKETPKGGQAQPKRAKKKGGDKLRGTQGGGIQKKQQAPAGRPNQRQRNRRNQNQQNFNQFPQQVRGRGFGVPIAAQGSANIDISNLQFGVTDGDIQELFSEFGQIKSAGIHFGSNGISLGTAHVHFARPGSAMKALNKYNGVHLDGRPMRIVLKNTGQMQGGAGALRGQNIGGRISGQGNRGRNQGQRNQTGNQGQRNQAGNQGQKKGGNQPPKKKGRHQCPK